MRDLRRWAVPGIPFVFSLLLSALTVSTRVFWQDSGFFLTAVHEMSVLHPHGFVLYLLLCKAWTLVAAPFLGFTLAVHLFSALCAAGAAAFLALAARAFLRRLHPAEDPELPAIAAACLVATGYSFWAAAILAKPYALLYLALAALLWIMAVAAKKRDFLAMGAVLGLAWAAHPSAALVLPAMLIYAALRRDRIREWGWGFFAAVSAIAAVCAFAPGALLPVLASRESPYSIGDPRSAAEVWGYLRGERFVSPQGAFVFRGDRWVQGSRFFWEEYLGGGLLLLALGARATASACPKALLLGLSWTLPLGVVTLLFVGEGQHDLWLVSAYLPFSMLLAAGVAVVARKGRSFGLAAAGLSIAWMLGANFFDLRQSSYPYAETMGRYLLKNLEPGSRVLLSADDSLATTSYLQTVRRERTDVIVISRSNLGCPWYDRLLARNPGVRIPDWEGSWRAMPGLPKSKLEVNGFANENVGPGLPLYTEVAPDLRYLRPGLAIVPAGFLWKICVAAEAVLDPKYFDLPADLPALAKDVRRPRGIIFRSDEQGLSTHPEPFEHRLILRLLRARIRLADVVLEQSPPGALEQYDLVRRVWPAFTEDPEFLPQWGRALFRCGRSADARLVFETLLKLPDVSNRSRASACYHLGELSFAEGRKDEARGHFESALRAGELNAAWKTQIEERLRQP